MPAQTFPVVGLTCEHCANAVRSEVSAIDGVTDVVVGLEPGATSTVTVTSSAPITDGQVSAALHEAGDYELSETRLTDTDTDTAT